MQGRTKAECKEITSQEVYIVFSTFICRIDFVPAKTALGAKARSVNEESLSATDL